MHRVPGTLAASLRALCDQSAVAVSIPNAGDIDPRIWGYRLVTEAGRAEAVPAPRMYGSIVDLLRLTLVVINSLAFLVLMVMSIRLGRREKYVWVRRLWLIIALACGALILGSIQRLALQAASIDLIPATVGDVFTSELQLIQSLAVLILLIFAFLTIRRLADSMDASERLSASLLDRVRHIDPSRLDLTNREREVLALIGGGVATDSALAAELHISTSTVQSHVKSLYRKSGLRSRTDLIALAVLVESARIGS